MRNGIFIIFCSFILAACNNRNRIPSGVIQPQKMQAILWDMMRADQFLMDYVFIKDTVHDKKAEKIKMYKKVFDIHQISKEDFKKSFSFYKDHPSRLKALMDSMSRPKMEAPTQMITDPLMKDSLQNTPRSLPQPDSIKPFRKLKSISLQKRLPDYTGNILNFTS